VPDGALKVLRTESHREWAKRSNPTRPYDASTAPVATRAKGCGPTGMFDPITRTDQSPTIADFRIAASSTFVVSNGPAGRDSAWANGAKSLPRYTGPSGAVTSRPRSFMR